MNLSINVFGVRFVDLTLAVEDGYATGAARFARALLDIRPTEAVEVDRIARRGVRALSRWWTERMF
ncbi:Uncharacterised protein [Mycobacteroides abscessus subsp. massiliense]|nr:Uncharacterised protein [Mycobacteroides abscessus subsp. massiliense]SKH39899.1 Uncharacterised protein [Mycobacteroides abscessus subsp. massiliense]SKH90275.1 Uncharacterised protein [Mycobacteroides abscessus subsp. massiliense]SKK83666.1 Uncharacterised protein [Mycobacteroides abscessus subsp. massiliense]SKK90112.1 Uncharacterised protein [Mycobacteroides abscessus subsp. massiliense]